MYGYVTPDKSQLLTKDFLLFRAFYCGICKTTGKVMGAFPRLTTNYDIAFLAVFLHSYMEIQPDFSNEACILNPFKKKHIVVMNTLMQDIMHLNVIMAYHSIMDNIVDGGGVKYRIPARVLRKAYRRAAAACPEIDSIVIKRYAELTAAESAKVSGIDRVSDSFASMMRDCVRVLTKDKPSAELDNFVYNLGKYVYLIDGLDDVGEDARSGNYNPFLAAYGADKYKSREQFFADNSDSIGFVMNITVNQMITSFNAMGLTEGRDLISNFVYYGFRRKLDMILKSKRKLKQERV